MVMRYLQALNCLQNNAIGQAQCSKEQHDSPSVMHLISATATQTSVSHGCGSGNFGVHLQDGLSRGHYNWAFDSEDEDPPARQ